MMKNNFIAYVILAIACSSVFCSKKENWPPKSPEQLLTQATWTLVSAGFDDNKNGVIDPEEESIKECEKDNTLVFDTQRHGIFSDNAILCGGPQQGNFKWQLSDNGNKLHVDGSVSEILTLNETELKYTPILEGLIVSFIITYQH